jgi:hypothetical protein
MTRKWFAWVILPGIVMTVMLTLGSYELGVNAATRHVATGSAVTAAAQATGLAPVNAGEPAQAPILALATNTVQVTAGPNVARTPAGALPATAVPAATATAVQAAATPVATATVSATATNTAAPSATATQAPTATPTPAPTAPVVQVSQPTIQLIAPVAGSSYLTGQQVTVQSVATAAGGVSQIQLLVDNAIVQTTAGGAGQGTLQASQTWQATSEGSHILSVIAVDMYGNRSQPASISVTVNANAAAPQVTIQQPGQTTVVQAGQVVTIQSLATSDNGIGRSELWVDSALYATSSGGGATSFTASQAWSSTTLGEHTLFVRAYDNLGQATDSASITIGVVDTNPPQVTASIRSNTVPLGQLVTVFSNATDSKGITSIELWADGYQIAVANSASSVGQSPMGAAQAWQAAVPGPHILYVIARDSTGKSSQSSSITINVVAAPAATPAPQTAGVQAAPTATRQPTPTHTPAPTATTQPTPTHTPAPTATTQPTPTQAPTGTVAPTNTPGPALTAQPPSKVAPIQTPLPVTGR